MSIAKPHTSVSAAVMLNLARRQATRNRAIVSPAFRQLQHQLRIPLPFPHLKRYSDKIPCSDDKTLLYSEDEEIRLQEEGLGRRRI